MQGTSKIRQAELKLRLMEDHIKEQNKQTLSAQWATDLRSKDELASKKRIQEDFKAERTSTIEIGKLVRQQKIAALLKAEEAQYSKELEALGFCIKSELV